MHLPIAKLKNRISVLIAEHKDQSPDQLAEVIIRELGLRLEIGMEPTLVTTITSGSDWGESK
jgi:hypothetical protein